MSDKVNSPTHYTSNPFGLETIEITQWYNFCVGNSLKYILRAGLKAEEGYNQKKKKIEDLKKAIWYLNKEISNLEQGVYDGEKNEKQNETMEKDGHRKTHSTTVALPTEYGNRVTSTITKFDEACWGIPIK